MMMWVIGYVSFGYMFVCLVFLFSFYLFVDMLRYCLFACGGRIERKERELLKA